MRGLGLPRLCLVAVAMLCSLAIAVSTGAAAITGGGSLAGVHHAILAGSLRSVPAAASTARTAVVRRVATGVPGDGARAPQILAPAGGLVRSLPASGGIVALMVRAQGATSCSLSVVATGGLTVTPMQRSGCSGTDDLVVGANRLPRPATLVVAISARREMLDAIRLVQVHVAAGAPSARDVASFHGTLSANWSGYLAPSATIVTDTAGDFAIPSVDCAAAPQGAGVSFWVGTGGSSGGQPLLQTGITESCTGAALRLRAWWEEVPSQPDRAQFFAHFAIHVGDHLHAEVFRGVDGRWETLLVDQTTGQRAVMVTGEGWGVAASSGAPVLMQDHRAPAGFPGAQSAEWITEDYASAGANSLVPLLDFGAVTFTKVRAGPAVVLAPDDAVAIEKSGSLCARPSPLTGNRFLVRELGGP